MAPRAALRRRNMPHRRTAGTSSCECTLPPGHAPKPGMPVSHKFKIGQLVDYFSRERASGVYEVTQLLPPEGDTFQYRIKNANEPHERVVKEHELDSRGDFGAPVRPSGRAGRGRA
jgi:hypothetical protein